MNLAFWRKKEAPQNSASFDEIIAALDGLTRTSSGVAVSELTAMQTATVNACVRIISEAIAVNPIRLYKRAGDKSIEVESHDALDLLHTPNRYQTPHEFKQFLVQNLELHGNAYTIKTKYGGKIQELLSVPAVSVMPIVNPDWTVGYKLTTLNGQFDHTSDSIAHWKGMSLDGFVGLSTISSHKEEIGLAIQTRTHGAAVFKNGASIGKVLEHPGRLDTPAIERLRKSLEKYQTAENAGKVFVAEEGMKLTNIGMTSQDAQYLETRQFTKAEISSIFGVPLFLLNSTEKSTTWGSGLEQIGRAFLTYSLAPRMNRICERLGKELLPVNQRRDHYFSFDTRRFNLGDLKDRFEAYSKGVTAGIINPNEARDLENMNPREKGDEYQMGLNMTTGGQNEE